MYVNFRDVKIGQRFTFDGDYFKKTGEFIAWEIQDGKLVKEWFFNGHERVRV